MLSIGEFSRICKVSTKTLRYYDEIGLIKPSKINPENNYRYYSIEQLETILLINRLTHYNFSLEEIRTIITSEEMLNEKLCLELYKKKKEFEKQKIQGIQYLPVRVVDVLTHSVSHNYYAVNILNWIDGIDMEASEWEYEEEDDAYFFEPKGMVLDEQKCEGYDIFRCTKDTICIFVSEKIKKIFEKNNWQWFSLSEMPSTHKIK